MGVSANVCGVFFLGTDGDLELGIMIVVQHDDYLISVNHTSCLLVHFPKRAVLARAGQPELEA